MKTVFILLIIITCCVSVFAQKEQRSELIRIEASPADGFSYAYYLFIPESVTDAPAPRTQRSLLVLPNNTGKIDDDIAVHDSDVKRKMGSIGSYLTTLGWKVPVLTPVFPRPASDNTIYTHSLDRDTMVNHKKPFFRLDRQLIAMIRDAQRRMATDGIPTEEKVLMQGYSASGMFVNRFVFLHPQIVKAAVVGAPGGWAIAPVDRFNGKTLTFPAGIADLKKVAGKKFDLEAVRKVPLFMILGAEDTNDAVPMNDAYDKRESELVISMFGKTPVERFPHSQKLYKDAGLNAEFRLYPDTTHQMSAQMRDDQLKFLKQYALE
jgi:hypothetical protein